MKLLRLSMIVLVVCVFLIGIGLSGVEAKTKSEAAGKTVTFDLLIKGDAKIFCPSSWKEEKRSDPPFLGVIYCQGTTIFWTNGVEEGFPNCKAGAACNASSTLSDANRMRNEMLASWKADQKKYAMDGKVSFSEKPAKIGRLNGGSYKSTEYLAKYDAGECTIVESLILAVGAQASYENGNSSDGDPSYPVYYLIYSTSTRHPSNALGIKEKIISSFMVP